MWYFMILPKKTFFQDIELKLNDWMTLKPSMVIFQALKPLQPQWPKQSDFIKKNSDPAGSMIPGTKMTNTGPFLWNGSSKIQFFTDFSTFSVRGCWGQLMLLFWKLIHETQNLLPPEATRHHNSTKLLIFLPLRADLLCNLHYETPCSSWLYLVS